MPWYYNIIPESIKKNVCAYLLQRYLGQFFEEKLTRDQLNVDLYNGTGTVEKISLDVEVLNELSEKQNWPMEFVDGYIEKLHLSVPWTSILRDPSYVEVKGLKLTLQPKQRNESATSMFESMWNSMTSSMQLAEECAKQDAFNAASNAQTYEGIELFAQTIDSILSRVRVTFVDTVIQIEHVPQDSSTGVGVIINIDLIEYSDEAGTDPTPEEATDLTSQDSKKAYLVQSFTTKRFSVQGVTLSTVEFSSKARTFSRSLLLQSQHADAEREDSLVTLMRRADVDDADESNGVEGGDRERTPTERCEPLPDLESQLNGDRHVVLFGKCCNKQEIRIRLKQSENLSGPKVSIEINVGSLILFLSPRQFHVLMELANGLARPDIEDHSNIAPKTRCTQKPMTGLDYQRVEQELQHQLQPLSGFQVGGLQGAHGWSTAALDDSEPEENFLPMRSAASGMYDSTLSGNSSSMDSSISLSMASSFTEQTQRTRRRAHNIDTDPTAEISHFQVRLASLVAILLHEDLLIQPADSGQILAPSSVRQMQLIAERFFDGLPHFMLTAYGNKDFENTKGVFEKLCKMNHIRLLAAPVQIEGDEKTTSSAFSISGNMTAAKLEVLECLYETPEGPVEYVPLLTFTEAAPTHTASPTTAKPSLRLSFKHIEKTARNGAPRRNSGPRTDVSVMLNKCAIDSDITIVDRITALLNPPNICPIDKSSYNPWSAKSMPEQLARNSPVESRLDLKIMSPTINFKLRFPIPDFRPPHDINRVPWWKRHVRSDYLSVVLSDATIQTTFQTNQNFQEYNVQSRGIDVFYHETENGVALPLAKAGFDEKYASSMQDVLLQSRLCIKIFPPSPDDLDISSESEVDPMTTSYYGAFDAHTVRDTGPFSAKRVVYESDTPHSKPHKDHSGELIIPGDKTELEEFIKSATASCRIHVEVFLPTVSLQLASKHVYELIYNRINNDLLLWEPSAPKPKANLYEAASHASYSAFPAKCADARDTFLNCKSGIQYESESESDEESMIGDSLFFSTYEKSTKPAAKPRQSPEPEEKKPKGPNYLVLNLQIGQGLVTMNPPVRDVTTNNVIPGQQGEFLVNVEDANVFVVNGYKGDEDLGYVCVQVHSAQLFHCDMTRIPSMSPPLKEIGTAVGRHLHPTIYKAEAGMMANAKDRGGGREMLTVAVKIQANHETHHVKTIQIAVGVNKSTLRHRMCNEPNSWISHLLDFFNVQDYPIPGYHAKDVLTELHLHLWDCAIDYRPLHMPLRSAITVGNFTMSSHLSAQANSSTLRFIFEECGLFLSEKAPPRNGVASSTPVDLKRDYVNVIEFGVFELSLKTNDKKSGINPHIDLRASNNILNIHTCSDSGRALMQLITYFASDGDVAPPSASAAERSPFSSPRHQAEQELVKLEPQGVSNLSQSQQEHITNLIEDAMVESDAETESVEPLPNVGTKVFYFPDERQGPIPSHQAEAAGPSSPLVVAREPGPSNPWLDRCPSIKWLTNDPVTVLDDYITIPVARADLLKSPKHFPTPVMRYTLCEMSIVWHLYGGHDFQLPDKEGKKKTVNFSDTQTGDSVSFKRGRGGGVTIGNSSDRRRANMAWMLRGGVNRDHDVLMELQLNKVRFQHEQYPETTKQASRQVLLISDVEIRDRLKSSRINKFLYEYTSQAMPKQTNANMILIKAIHLRPDQNLKTQECCLKISLLPLRLNIDQDALLFLITFFNELGGGGKSTEADDASNASKHSTPTHQPPVMSISSESEDLMKQQAHKVVNENLIMLMEENRSQQESVDPVASTSGGVSDDSPIYFRTVLFTPAVPIRLDYHGKRVDMTHGSLPGLLMGLGQLNCSELRLKQINYRHGLLGFDKLVAFLLQEWLNDIKKNQLPSLLGGVGPMHSLVQLFQGIRDLFWMPIEQYQKDGRIVRGLQRGANSFSTSTAMAALELTSRLIHLIQVTAETAYDMLSPGPSVRRVTRNRGRRKRYHQPQDIREGMTNAYMVVKEGIGETSDNILQVVSREKEQKGYSGVVGGVLRQIPPTILKPVIIASEATNNVLGGMRSQLVPDARREANQKWRSDDS